MNAVDTKPPAHPTSQRTLRQPVRVRDGKWWLPGTLRAWQDGPEGERLALVTWSPTPGEFRIDRIPAGRIREV